MDQRAQEEQGGGRRRADGGGGRPPARQPAVSDGLLCRLCRLYWHGTDVADCWGYPSGDSKFCLCTVRLPGSPRRSERRGGQEARTGYAEGEVGGHTHTCPCTRRPHPHAGSWPCMMQEGRRAFMANLKKPKRRWFSALARPLARQQKPRRCGKKIKFRSALIASVSSRRARAPLAHCNRASCPCRSLTRVRVRLAGPPVFRARMQHERPYST